MSAKSMRKWYPAGSQHLHRKFYKVLGKIRVIHLSEKNHKSKSCIPTQIPCFIFGVMAYLRWKQVRFWEKWDRSWKDETEGVPIKEFVTGGPKNYTYKLQNGKTECKIRGFTLDEQGSNILNFESMKHHILAEIYDPQDERRTMDVPLSISFERNQTTKKTRLEPKVKKYGLVFNKRVIKTGDRSSRPYRYEWVRETT